MTPKPSQILFLLTLVRGTSIRISSSTWIGAWIGLEINILSFIPLISKRINQRTTESSIKYFIVQAVGSVIIITIAIASTMASTIFFSWVLKTPLVLALLLKAGAAPIHFWFPGVIEGLRWNNCILLITWQKVAPLALISYTDSTQIMTTSALLSGAVGAVGGVNQTLLRKLIAYSSIGHMGWILASIISRETFWLIYIVIYSLLSVTVARSLNKTNTFHIAQYFHNKNIRTMTKYALRTNLLSLGGLPPFLGFLPKWIAIQIIITNRPITTLLLICAALTNLYYYLRLTFAALMTTQINQKWRIKSTIAPNLGKETIIAIISATGLLIIPTLWPI